MGKGFHFLDDIAMADLAFAAWGDTPSELLTAAGEGLVDAMVNPTTVGTRWKQEISIAQSTLPDLLFEWLSNLVYLKDAEAVLFHHVQAEVWYDASSENWHLRGQVAGDHIDQLTQELRADVKAITKHMYEVNENSSQYRARIVLDV